MFLTDKELFGLTGFKRFKQQKGWLDLNGWMYVLDRHGRPKVAVEYWRQKMGVFSTENKTWEPDFSCLNI